MNQSATVHSIDAVRDFRAALQEFSEETRAALVDVDLELRRSLEWLLERQPAYWRSEVRKATDAITRAKDELHQARMKTLPGGGTPSCMDERKAVERAERRLRYAEEKVETVREWGRVEQHEVAEYEGRAMQLTSVLDVTLPRAATFLEHAIGHLESYLAVGPTAGPAATSRVKAASMPGATSIDRDAAPANSSRAKVDAGELPGDPLAESSP